MNPFRFLTRVFIDAFGITRLNQKQETRATWVISAMLAVIVLGAAAFLFVLHGLSHR